MMSSRTRSYFSTFIIERACCPLAACATGITLAQESARKDIAVTCLVIDDEDGGVIHVVAASLTSFNTAYKKDDTGSFISGAAHYKFIGGRQPGCRPRC